MALTANEIWRDFEVIANPASGAHKPIKADIRAWGSQFEALGGFNAPGADPTMALFSAGVGVPATYRKIVGGDLPNPSDQVPGAVYTKPFVPGQILAGLEGDGKFTVAATSGSGSIVLTDNPNFTGTVHINGANFIGVSGGTHVMYAPDGRLGIQLGNAGNPNFYKAETHSFYNAAGTNLFAQLNQYLWALTPQPLTSALAGPALSITQTWNTTGLAQCFDLKITDTASAIGSAFLRARGGTSGNTQLWFVDKGGSGTYAGNLNIGLSVVVGTKNYLRFNGTNFDINNVPGGTRWLNDIGNKQLEILANDGKHSFFGATSGSHDVSAPAAAAGQSTWPITSGELFNTGMGFPLVIAQATVDLSVVGDTQIPIKLPAGQTKYRFGAIVLINTGPGATSLTGTAGAYSAPSAGGLTLVAPVALTPITQQNPGVAGSMMQFTNAILNCYFDIAQTPILYFRVTVAQAGASGKVNVQIVPSG